MNYRYFKGRTNNIGDEKCPLNFKLEILFIHVLHFSPLYFDYSHQKQIGYKFVHKECIYKNIEDETIIWMMKPQ